MVFGDKDNHVPLEGRDLIRSTLRGHGVTLTFIEIIEAQHAFILDEFPKDRYNPAITKACFEWLLELFHRRFAMDLGDNDGKAVEIEDVC